MTKPIALVYTMHKVGSSCVMQALRSIERLPERGYAENLDNYLRPLSKYEKVITMSRDPVARNISRFFNIYNQSLVGLSPKEIETQFMKFNWDYPLKWFDTYFNPHFFNVYDSTFYRKRGWQIYGDILVIRMENLSSGLQNAFIQLFDLPEDTHVQVEHRANATLNKEYGETYADFLEYIKFDDDFLDKMYDNQYCNHFYYKKEIAEFKKRWSRK